MSFASNLSNLLETKIDAVEAADVLRWTDHRDDVQKAMGDLDSFVRERS